MIHAPSVVTRSITLEKLQAAILEDIGGRAASEMSDSTLQQTAEPGNESNLCKLRTFFRHEQALLCASDVDLTEAYL